MNPANTETRSYVTSRESWNFNRRHSGERFDGIHLDIEPQQRPENKGPGNLRFLPGLADAYRAVCRLSRNQPV